MFFSSVKKVTGLRKVMNRLLTQGMFLIQLNRLREKKKFFKKWNVKYKLLFSKLRFSVFKKFVTVSDFWEHQPMEIFLNFKASYCNLKTRGLGDKLCVAFPLF